MFTDGISRSDSGLTSAPVQWNSKQPTHRKSGQYFTLGTSSILSRR